MNKETEPWEKRIETLYKCNYERANAFEKEFKGCELIPEKRVECSKNDILLICIVKDDLIRIKNFICHYRKLNVSHFIFVDNNSSDGTFEFLIEQNDCDVYRCKQDYSSIRRVVWINKIISMYGTDKWYVMVDSDEFIYYQNMEKISLVDIIHLAERKGISRISGYLLDMYPKGNLFELGCEDDFLVKYNYYDVKGYDIHNTNSGLSIEGGPRRRVFKVHNELAKCPIFRLNSDDVVASSHFLLPRIKAKENPIWIAIGHYKFINDNDINKINDAVKKENYACGSAEYKAYQKAICKGDVSSLYDPSFSVELVDSRSLMELPYISFPVGEINE